MTAAEAQYLTDAGLLILSIYETTADRAKGGAVNGKADGAAALQLARDIDMPEHGYIYFAVDYDAPVSEMETVAAYLQAAREQVKPYKIGVYGGYRVIEAMAQRGACDGYWQACAWAYGNGRSQYAGVHQTSTPQTVAGISVDLDEAYGFKGLWNYNTTQEAIALADELELSSPDYWGKVFLGRTALKPEYLKALMLKAAGYGVEKLFDNI